MWNDGEWLHQLRTRPLETLSLDELRHVRRRMSESPEFLEALTSDVTLARVVDAVMEIPERELATPVTTATPTLGRAPWRRILLILALLAIPALIAAWRVSISDDAPAPAANAPSPADSPAADDSPTAASKAPSADAEPPAPPPPDPAPTVPEAPPTATAPTGPMTVAAPPAANPPAAPSDAAPPPPPWQTALDVELPAPAFAPQCWEGFDMSVALPTRQSLQAWFETVPGHGLRWSDTRVPAGVCATFEGVMRLKAPLGEDRVLRLAIDNFPRLQLHFFSGRTGVTLVWANDDPRWSAYSVTRESEHALPNAWRLAATDGGRSRRAEFRAAGAWELRYRDGYLVINRGDIVLLRVPFAETPRDVYFQGRATFYGLALARSVDGPPVAPQWPDEAPLPPQNEATTLPPPDQWARSLEDSTRWLKTTEGEWRLETDGAKSRGWAAVALPRVGLHEIIVRWRNPSIGAGLFLGTEKDPPQQVLRVVQDKRSGQRALAWCGNDDRIETTLPNPVESIAPLTHDSPWIRFVVGCGLLRAWQSGDGMHWVELPQLARLGTRGLTHLGMHHVGAQKPATQAIAQIWTRPLAALTQSADASLVVDSSALLAATDFANWERAADQGRPQSAGERAWTRACAAATLAAGTNGNWNAAVLERWLDALEPDLPLENRFAIYQEAATLLDIPDGGGSGVNLAARYRRAGWDAFLRDSAPPVSAVRPAIQRASMHVRQNDLAFETRSVRAELLMYLYAGRWSETIELVRQLRFFHQQAQTPVLDWADAVARRATPGPDAPGNAASASPPGAVKSAAGPARRRRSGDSGRLKEGWQPLLYEELGKETYNALAELDGLLAADAFDDAARLVTQLNPSQVQGLAPLDADDELLASLPTAVSWFAAEHPALRDAVRAKFNNLAPLRMRPAMLTGEPSEVELAALQFAGTAAAAEGHRWLGDRALASGVFPAARAAYRRALSGTPDAQRMALESRLRLVNALLGEDYGTAPQQPVVFGAHTMSVGDFESLVADARQRAQQGKRVTAERRPEALAPRTPRPAAALEPQPRGMVDGPVGERPQEEVTRWLDRLEVDWAGRQLGWTLDGDTLYVNNRFHIAAYQLATGQRLWQTAVPESKKVPRSRDWSLVAMTPRIDGNRIYARILYGDGPLLGCWDAATGQNVWLADQLQGVHAASDPWVFQDRLLVFTVTRTENSDALLRLATFDALTGELLGQADVLQMRSSWYARHCCETTLADDMLIASLGGAIAACDLRGQVRWVRRQVTLPSEEDGEWVLQAIEAPLVQGDRLYSAQPGVRALDCIDLETGRRRWRAFIPDLRRLVAVLEDRLIVATDRGLEARGARDGARLWEHEVRRPLWGCLAGGPHGVIYSQTSPPDNEKKLTPELVWLDPATGLPRAACSLPTLADPAPRLGPLVPYGERFMVFYGRGQAEPKRELLELIYR